MTRTIVSRDGTRIAYEQVGRGPAVALVTGAFNDRHTGAELAAALAERFTVFTYDRRGHGDSGDTLPYAVEREIEDLAAVVAAAGGSAAVLGYSSGAALALLAAASGVAITRLALYDLPPAQPARHATELAARVGAGRLGEAVEYFQREVVGIPEAVVAQLRHAPFRPALEAMAHTLVYDALLVSEGRLSADVLAKVRQPTLAIAGGASHPGMRKVAEGVARAVPRGEALVIEEATHDLVAEELCPVLERFFG